jgi:hypothetical protein
MKDALRVSDEAGAKAKAVELDVLIASATETEEAWRELQQAAKHKADLAGKEWKRLVDMRQLVTAERAMVLVTAIMDVVLRNTPEPQQRLEISNGIFALIADERKPAETNGDETRI